MPWFQARERIQIAPREYVEAGERFEYPRRAGLALVGANRADWSERPQPRADEATSDAGPETNPQEASETESGDGAAVPLNDVGWTDIEGVGEATASDFEEWLSDEELETADDLLEAGVESLPGVGESTAGDVREHLESL